MTKPLPWVLALCVLLSGEARSGTAIRYVDCDDGHDGNDGLSAATPKRSLQAALDGIPNGCSRPVELHVLPGACRVAPTAGTVPGTIEPPSPFDDALVGIWPDTSILGAGIQQSSLSGDIGALRFVDRAVCGPGGPRLVLQDLFLDFDDDQGEGIRLPARDRLEARRVVFVNRTSAPGTPDVTLEDCGFAAGLDLEDVGGLIKGCSFGGNHIGDAGDSLLILGVRKGAQFLVSDASLGSEYFYGGIVLTCRGEGADVIVEDSSFTLPAYGAIQVHGSAPCHVRIARNRFVYNSLWGLPGVGVDVRLPAGTVEVSGNLFDGPAAFTALSVDTASDLAVDFSQNTVARISKQDAVTLGGAADVRVRGNAFYGIGGAAIRVADGQEKPEVAFNNFDGVGNALCLGDDCLGTGQQVNVFGAGIGNLDLASGFHAPGAFPGDFHLDPGSPLVDAADPQDQTLRLDLDGRPRPMDGEGDGLAVCDIGAFESLPPAPGRRNAVDVLRPRPGGRRTADHAR